MKIISRMIMTIVLLLVALTAYGQDKHSETYIRQRIATIYQGVGKSTYDAEGNRVDYIQSPFNRDSAYCSQQYYALMKQALDICDKTDDVLFDYDHWVCGQDFSDDWSCKVAKVYNITDSTALVDLVGTCACPGVVLGIIEQNGAIGIGDEVLANVHHPRVVVSVIEPEILCE